MGRHYPTTLIYNQFSDKFPRLTSNFCRATADSPGTSMEESVQESPSEIHYAESDIPPLTELADDRSS